MNSLKAFEILKIPANSSLDDIKAAYRAQSLLVHPDRNHASGNGTNVAFLSVKEAYTFLIELEKFKQTLNKGKEKINSLPRQLPPNEFPLDLSLEEFLTGCTREETITCRETDENENESVQEKVVTMQVKPGSLNGTRVIVEREGDTAHGLIPANVVFILQERVHPLFKRARFDLKYTATITSEEALLGCEIQIPTLEKEFILLEVNESVNSRTVKVLQNRGFPYPNMPLKRGNLMVNFLFIDPLPDILLNIPVNLVEVLNGSKRNIPISRKMIDSDGKESEIDADFTLDIKAGIESGSKLHFPKQGHQRDGGKWSDLVCTIQDEPNETFKRCGIDIIYNAAITARHSREGCKLFIPTLDGRPIKWTIEGELNPAGYRIIGKGLPAAGNNEKRGDLVVQFKIVQQGPPIEREVFLSLKEVLKGCTKTVEHTRKVINEDGDEILEEKSFTLSFKAGVQEGTEITFPQEGEQDAESVPADLVFIARDQENEQFKREGANLKYTLKVTRFQLENGGKFEIPTLDGASKLLYLDGPINETFVKHIKKLGLPLATDPSQFGDLLVCFELLPEVKPKDADIEHKLPLTLENILHGCSKNLKINRLVLNGDGSNSYEDKIITIDVPPGTIAGTEFRFENCGDETAGTTPADVLFIAVDKANSTFTRNGANIEYRALVTATEARNGVELDIPTLEENEGILLASKGQLSASVTKNYPNRGLPLPNQPDKRGDLIVRFEIVPNNRKDADIEHPLLISLENILTGCQKQLKISRTSQFNSKETIVEKTVDICIKPGTEAGTRFTFSRQANQQPGTIPGDVVFVITEKAHSCFKRSGANLLYTSKITPEEMAKGDFQVDVPTLENEMKHLKIDKLESRQATRRIHNKGLPLTKNPTVRGDIIVNFEIVELQEEAGQLDPVYVDLELTLEEIYEGCTKVIPFDRKIITQDQLDYFDVKVFTIKIPPGIEAGKTFPIAKEGNRCYGKTPGDVIFVVKEKEHEQFQRKGANLEHTIEITHNESVFGFQRKIPLLGSIPFYLLKVSRHYHSNTKVLEGYGMPFPYDSEKNGDLTVQLKIIDSGSGKQLVFPPIELKLNLSLEEVLNGYSKNYIFHKKIFRADGKMHQVDEILEIRTRPGIETNERIVFEKRGHQYPSAIPADVIFTVQDRPHPYLKRVGADLEYTTSIGKTEALYGFMRYIPTLEKGGHQLEVNELVRLNTVKIIPEKGLPLSDNPEKRGNIIVKFRIVKDKIHGYRGGKN